MQAWRSLYAALLTFLQNHTQPDSDIPEGNTTSVPGKENLVFFRRNACPAVHQALIGFDSLSNSTLVRKNVFALARGEAWIASVTKLLVDNESPGDRRPKDHTDAFAKNLSTATNHLIVSAHQLVQHWHSEVLEVETESESIEARKKFVFAMSPTATNIVTMLSV